MKRFCNRLITGIGLAALLSLTGCGDNEPEPKKNPEVRDAQENVSILKKDDLGAAVQQEKISKKEQLRRDSFRTKRPAGSFAEKSGIRRQQAEYCLPAFSVWPAGVCPQVTGPVCVF